MLWRLTRKIPLPWMPLTGSGGVFKSTDRGRNWQPANDGLDDYAYVQTLAIHPAPLVTLYAGGDGAQYKSINGGGHWSKVTAGWDNTYARPPWSSTRPGRPPCTPAR